MRLYAKWADDCQGKKDYDGRMIEISTRYWPEGGGFHISHGHGDLTLSTDPAIKPSANCSVVICHGIKEDGDGGPDTETLIEKDFTADTFEQVAIEVETFAQTQMDFIVKSLKDAYRT